VKVQLQDLSSTRKRLEVEVPPERVGKVVEAVLREVQKRAHIKGFRKGKAPLQLVKTLYKDQVENEAIERLLKETLNEVLEKENIEAITVPKVEAGPLEENKAFTYWAIVDVRPQVTLKEYKGLRLEVKRFKPIDEEAVSEHIKLMQEQLAQLRPVEGRDEVKKGDWVLVDFETRMDDKLVPGGKVENHLFEVGSGTMIPGFEEAIEGMRVGETKEFSLVMPSDHPREDLAGKEVMFRVTLKEIRERVLPPVDDHFAKDLGFENLEDLKSKVKEELERRQREAEKAFLRQRLLEELLEKNPLEVPQSLVERRAQELLRRIEERVPSLSEEKLQEAYGDCLKIAEREFKTFYLVEEIAKREGINVGEEEIDEYLKASQVPEPLFKSPSLRDRAKRELKREKVFEFLLKEAQIEYVD